MQVCDFCPTTETRNKAGKSASVRRFRLEVHDINPTSSTEWSQHRYWWLLDLCEMCIKDFAKTLDNLVVPEDVNPARIDSKSTKPDLNRKV